MSGAGRAARAATLVAASGSVLFAFSERLFWSFWRRGDTPGELLITWLAYCLLAWIFLAIVRAWRVDGPWPLFLAGAVYGWIGEGVLVDTLYGGPGNPLPLSISWTGLAWHALLSVWVGWYALRLALTAGPATRAAGVCAAIGAGWGAWALWWPREPEGIVSVGVGAFASHALFVWALLSAAAWAWGAAGADAFRPGRGQHMGLALLVLAFFGLVRAPVTPAAAAVLPPLLALCWLGLRAHRRVASGPDLLDVLSKPVPPLRLLALAAMPAAAIAVYGAGRAAGLAPPTNVAVYLVTTPLGFACFAWALLVCMRGRAGRPAAGAP
ncbi:MAG: hypothetical protein IT208_17150 [Chthonomonadales bacterium]|nr:hypothetical protein [Chthonomonadales bacterium]